LRTLSSSTARLSIAVRCALRALTPGYGRCYVYHRYSTTIKNHRDMMHDRIQPAPRDEKGAVPPEYDILDVDGICRCVCVLRC
jgi:hypothetical protein